MWLRTIDIDILNVFMTIGIFECFDEFLRIIFEGLRINIKISIFFVDNSKSLENMLWDGCLKNKKNFFEDEEDPLELFNRNKISMCDNIIINIDSTELMLTVDLLKIYIFMHVTCNFLV